MKSLVLLMIVVLAINLTAENSYRNRFQTKSGHVEYKLTGNTTGTKSVWFDDFGNLYREEIKSVSTIKMFGMTQKTEVHSLTIADDTYYYNIDYIGNSASKTKKSDVPDFTAMTAGMTDAEVEQMGEDIVEDLDGKVVKNKTTILGKTCDYATVMGGEAYTYKGVALRTSAKIMGVETHEEAISFEENIKVPAGKFTPPKDVTYEEVNLEGQFDLFTAMNEGMEYEDENTESYPFPSGLSYDAFKKALNPIKSMGYSLIMYDNSGGEYSALFSKPANNPSGADVLAITALSYSQNPSREDILAAADIDYFNEGGKKMGYIISHDEEDPDTESSTLFVEIPNKDVFLQVSAVPVKSKVDMIKFFKAMKW